VVFADAEKVDAEIVGENRLVDDVANDLGMLTPGLVDATQGPVI